MFRANWASESWPERRNWNVLLVGHENILILLLLASARLELRAHFGTPNLLLALVSVQFRGMLAKWLTLAGRQVAPVPSRIVWSADNFAAALCFARTGCTRTSEAKFASLVHFLQSETVLASGPDKVDATTEPGLAH